jgi:glycosyltransferase involved in cell wall biosynthesis
MKYSIIIPVFNRPKEVEELLESLVHQSLTDFEVIIVEDGSTICCQNICEQYKGKMDIHYFMKKNSGPGQSRNYGAKHANGDYLLILDSDIVLPPDYIKAINDELIHKPADGFGGPDRAHPSFTDTQKAISYSMTSFFTTGGIRGGKKKLDKFYPRSFNMGIRKEVYQKLGGFSNMRFGEDIDFSIRIYKAGYRCRLFPKAWVWHKRRTDFHKFWRQVYNSGIARINLYKKYPESLKLVHLLPAVFTIGTTCLIFFAILGVILLMTTNNNNWKWLFITPLLPIMLYMVLLLVHSTLQNKNLKIGILSIIAAFIQLFGYGCGFLQAWWIRCIKKGKAFDAYQNNFYK